MAADPSIEPPVKPHPFTLAYIESARARPGMFYADHMLCDLEQQLHGFDAALSAARIRGENPAFNRAFDDFVAERTGLSSSQGWARALQGAHGHTSKAEQAFWRLFDEFMASS